MTFSRYSNQRFWVAVSVLLAIGAFYYFYFFIVVQNQQELLERRGFRILEEVERNMKEKLENYKGTIQNYQNQSDIINEIIDQIYDKIDPADDKREIYNKIAETLNEEAYYIDRRGEILNEISAIQFDGKSSFDIALDVHKILRQIMNYELIPRYQEDTAARKGEIFVSNAYHDWMLDDVDYYVHINNLMANLKFDAFFKDLLVQDSAKAVIYDPGGYNLRADTLYQLHMQYLGSYIVDLDIASTAYKAFVNPVNINDKEYFLMGILPSKQFKSRAQQLNPIILTAGVMIILIVIVALPLLKLSVMSKIERLKRSDIYLAGVSIIIISSILVLLLLNWYISYGDEKKKVDKNLSTLNETLIAELEEELRAIHDQLDQYVDSEELTSFAVTDPAEKDYPVYNELILINQSGYIHKYNASRYPYIVPKPNAFRLNINLKNRNYFQYAQSGSSLWRLGERKFYMEPVYSYTTNLIEAAVSMPGSPYIKALTAPIYSLIDVTLPRNYGYCIFDKNGRTLFHSTKNKSLRENFLLECDNHPEIVKALNHRVCRNINIEYNNKSCRTYVAPLITDDLRTPLFIATFYDQTANQSKNTSILLVAFALVLCLIALLLFISLLISLNNRKESRLKFRRFAFYWLLPHTRNRKNYLILTALNAANLLFLIWYYHLSADILNIILTVFIAVVFTALITYLALINFKFEDFFQYKKRRKFYLETLATALILLLAVNLLLFRNQPDILLFNIIYGLFIAGAIVSLFFYKKSSPRWDASPGPQSLYKYSSAYSFFLISWLIVIAITPAVLFYKTAYEDINRQTVKNIHRQAIADVEKRREYLSSGHLDEKQLEVKSALGTGFYLNCIYETELAGDYVAPRDNASSFNQVFFDELSKRVNVISPGNELTWHNYSRDSGYFNYADDDYFYTIYHDVSGENPVYLKAQLPQLQFPRFGDIYAILFWTGALALIAGLFYLTRFFIRRINIEHDATSLKPIEPNAFKTMADRKSIFLVGVPYSGKSKLIHSYLKNFKTEETAEFKIFNPSPEKIVEEVEKQNLKVVVLKDFEYNLHDIEFNGQKLQLLETLLRKDLRVIVSSTVGLKQLIDVYQARREAANDKAEKSALLHEIERWENLLYGYYTIYHPLKTTVKNRYTPEEKTILGDELEHGDYLAGLKSYISGMYNLRKPTAVDDAEKLREKAIIKIQEAAESYYYSLWNNCSRLEKYVLYDIADDGFVNSKNTPTIKRLIKSGLIRWNGRLQIMNESFRNFILTSTPSVEALAMEKEAKRKGSWSKFRLILGALILAVVVLFVMAEQDFVDKVSAVITAVAAMAPAVYTLGRSAFGGGE